MSANALSSLAEKSTLPLVVTMADEYRIRPDGPQFEIIDGAGETVGVCKTMRKAEHEITLCKKEDVMWESAKLLIEKAVKAYMKKHGVNSRTAHYWIREAAD
jgi:hypothetical protein